jgi:hypothetical protein
MSLVTRSLIAVFAGIGAGTIGFWATWKIISGVAHQNPALGHNGWLLAGIFAPGIAVALTAYHLLSRAQSAESPATSA